MPVSRQHARLLAKIARGECPRCPSGRLTINYRTRQLYRACAACRATKNDRQRMGPRQETP